MRYYGEARLEQVILFNSLQPLSRERLLFTMLVSCMKLNQRWRIIGCMLVLMASGCGGSNSSPANDGKINGQPLQGFVKIEDIKGEGYLTFYKNGDRFNEPSKKIRINHPIEYISKSSDYTFNISSQSGNDERGTSSLMLTRVKYENGNFRLSNESTIKVKWKISGSSGYLTLTSGINVSPNGQRLTFGTKERTENSDANSAENITYITDVNGNILVHFNGGLSSKWIDDDKIIVRVPGGFYIYDLKSDSTKRVGKPGLGSGNSDELPTGFDLHNNKIAFLHGSKLWVMNVDSEEIVQISDGNSLEGKGGISWTPDGSSIGVTSACDVSPSLSGVDPDHAKGLYLVSAARAMQRIVDDGTLLQRGTNCASFYFLP